MGGTPVALGVGNPVDSDTPVADTLEAVGYRPVGYRPVGVGTALGGSSVADNPLAVVGTLEAGILVAVDPGNPSGVVRGMMVDSDRS